MRRKIYGMVDPVVDNDILSKIYDFLMMSIIVISLVPLAFKNTNNYFEWIDRVCVIVFIIDYILRFITADFKLKKSVKSFFIYPFTFMAIIDLLSILPSLTLINSGLKVFRVFRLVRTFKVLRAFRFFRYSKSFDVIANVLKKQKRVLSAVATLAIGYIIVSALVIYNVEPNAFETFFDAIYWATISLTTVGYGDIYAVTTIGRIITMISSVLGIAIIALPSGVITAGYLSEINEQENKKSGDE